MSILRARTFRTIVVALCAALTALLAAQVSVAVADQAQHAIGADHAPIAVAGAVLLDHDDSSADHHHDAAQQTDDDGDRRLDPAPHHHGEGPQIAAFQSIEPAPVILARLVALFVPASASPPSAPLHGLERPPKAPLERPV